uniref:phosphomevalonate kinase n=1 Tax=Spongospora subterranea TaxID=70186 RepID=A0A0H5QYJ4_9EUKA|eukprot:CRZ07058.1 hypothetical protein [Spongospora subterranea]
MALSSWDDAIWDDLRDQDRNIVCCSAPGKVLIAGGYLVLDEQYTGTVLGISARFRSQITPLRPNQSTICPDVVLLAPQLSCQTTRWSLDASMALSLTSPPNNAFVFATVQCSFAVLNHALSQATFAEILGAGILIRTLADPQFYSGIGPDGVATSKTGLGSSATLVASLTSAIFAFFGHPDGHVGQICYRTAQMAHCVAQGQVGSGFDISAAFFGSQIYRRFPAATLQHFIANDVTHRHGNSPRLLLPSLPHVITDNQLWSGHHPRPFRLPPCIDLVLGDVYGGSRTPDMVRKVLAWRSNAPAAWEQLAALNSTFVDKLNALHEAFSVDPQSYRHVMGSAAVSDVTDWRTDAGNAIGDKLTEIRTTFSAIRAALRQMGSLACVDIEPNSQSRLLDATMAEAGVICAGVPGGKPHIILQFPIAFMSCCLMHLHLSVFSRLFFTEILLWSVLS